MNVSRPFIQRPVATTLLALAVFIGGLLAYTRLPIAPLPQVDFPTINVSANLPGASPETMASAVATPLERRLGRIAGVTEITSVSSLGSTSLTLQFDLTRDVDSCARDVQAAIVASGGELPTNLPFRPSYRKVNPADAPILILSLRSDTLPLGQVFDAANTVLAQKVSQVPGVGQVFVGGGQQPAVRVSVDPELLAGAGLGLEDVRRSIAEATVDQPKGSIGGPVEAQSIAANDQLLSAGQFKQVIVSHKSGAAIRLGDVAAVTDDVENNRLAAWADGKRAVVMVVRRQPGANILETIAGIKAVLPRLTESVSPAIHVDVAIDRAQMIRASVAEVEHTLLLSIGLVVLVVFAFLRSFRATLIPSVAVPLSLVATFAFMYALGYSLDNLSLMALTIATGFVVDDAIVVTENVARLLEEGKPPLEAALEGAKQIAFTIISITVSLIAVFIPILLMGGVVGRLFREFAVVLAISVAVSAVVSLTLTPMMCAKLLRHAPKEEENFVARIFERAFSLALRAYDVCLTLVLRFQRTTQLVALGTVGLTVYLGILVPKGLFPQQDSGQVSGFSDAPQDISFPAMKARQEALNAIVAADPDVDHFVSFMGAGGLTTVNTGSIFIQLKPRGQRKGSSDDFINRLRPKLAQVQGIQLFLQAMQDVRLGGRPTRTQYQYTLQDADLEELRAWSPRMLEALRQAPELRDVASDQQLSGLRLGLSIDRDTAARLGVSPGDVDAVLYDAYGQRQVATMFMARNQYRVVMEVKPEFQRGPESLDRLFVRSSTGAQIPIRALTRAETGPTALTINHQGQFPSVTLSFNVAPGAALGQAVEAIHRAEQRVGLPTSVHAGFAGTAQAFGDSLSSQPMLIAAALFTVYLVLGMLYESAIHPITILSTLPSAGVGALLALLLFKVEFSIIALIGIILLIGIVKKNAIMMIDVAIELSREGMPQEQAIHRACLQRFRPIVMTTLAALLGALPLALGSGMGAELRKPLGIAIVGGLIVSQALTLFTTPVIYLQLDRLRSRFVRPRAVVPSGGAGGPEGAAPLGLYYSVCTRSCGTGNRERPPVSIEVPSAPSFRLSAPRRRLLVAQSRRWGALPLRPPHVSARYASLREPRRARSALVVALLALAACSSPPSAAPPEVSGAPHAERGVTTGTPVEERRAFPLPALPEAPRGLGTMTARLPGTSEVVGGVRLASHHARVTIEKGIAHTEIEEEFQNDTGRVLEGRLVFPLPADASLARLALWVGRDLIEGEVVEKGRADRIFRGIVDDTVRPRDPALLDVVAGGKVSLRIFPIPAHGARKVVFAYDEVLRRQAGALRYVYPLSLGGDRATPVGELSVTVDGVTRLSAKNVVPTEDVVVTLDEAPPALVVGKLADAKNGDTRAVLARAVAHAPDGAARYHGDVVLALDVSEGQSQASLASQLHLAAATLATLGEDETFALLACDTACAAYPPEGLARPTPDAIDAAHRFLASLEPGGASDPAGALVDAASRLSPHRPGQVVLVSDGTATAGELAVTSQLAHAAPAVAALDVRVVGAGRAVDDRGLAALARGLGATYDRLSTGAPLAERVRQLAEARRVPVVRDARAPLPAGAIEIEPADATPTRDGDEVVGFARLPATVTVDATDAPDVVDGGARVPRLWARARVAELEQHGDEANAEITSLAVRHHLLSRTTSLLVLENDRMFAEFGIPRTVGPTDGPRATGGDGASVGEGFGSGHGRLSGSHMSRPPSVRMGSTMVSGRLPPEVVQRIVRQNFGRFRFCYEQGLRRDPTLAGRVSVRFIIGRDGAVAAVGDGGSDLPDARVVSCVVSAFSGLSFPQPEGGIVTVVYPIVFSDGSGGGPRPESAQRAPVPMSRPTSWQDLGARLPRNSALNPPAWEPPPPELPTVTHRAGDDRWLGRRSASLGQTMARVARDPARRQGHVQLVRELLSAGLLDEAYVAAQRFVELDPELPAARETLAEAAAAASHPREATRAMASAAALDRRSASRQLAAMRAALASGDTRRACAHARALGELAPKDHAARAAACRETGALSVPDTATPGFEARAACEAGACPDVVVITPGGRVLSRWTLGSTGLAAIAGPLVGGTYRTLIVSPAAAVATGHGTVTVRALGATLTVPVDGTRRTAIVSDVTIPAPRYYPRIRI